MFTKKVTDDDNFMSLSSSAQALYLHLSMSADDDGFCNQVSISMFKAHASVQDLQALLEKRYIYQFENGVIVIKHWRMANALRKDRYTPTAFQEELSHLGIKENGSYTWLPDGCQMVASCLPQDSIGKVSIGKVSIGEVNNSGGGGESISLYARECEKDISTFFAKYFGRQPTEYETEQISDAIGHLHHIVGETKPEFRYGDDEKELLERAIESAAKANKPNLAYITGCFRNFWQRGIRTGNDYEDYEIERVGLA